MAISMLVKSKAGDYDVPIATQDFFEFVWRPLSASLRLELIPQFEDNFRVDLATLPRIEKEITEMRSHISETAEGALISQFSILRRGDKDRVIERLDFILAQLQQLRNRQDWEAWIG